MEELLKELKLSTWLTESEAAERLRKALRSKGARELVIITAVDFRWLLGLARAKEEITVDASGAQMQAMGGVGGDTIHVVLPRAVGEWMGLVYEGERTGRAGF